MKKIDSRYLLDSSAWLSYFFGQHKSVVGIIEAPTTLFTSAISLFEIKRKLMKLEYSSNQIETSLCFIKENSVITHLENEQYESAAAVSIKKRLPAIDSLIYVAAKENNCILVTADNDFRKLKDVKFLE